MANASFDRQYGEMIKESLREWGSKSGPFVWLFSVREVKVSLQRLPLALRLIAYQGCLLQNHR